MPLSIQMRVALITLKRTEVRAPFAPFAIFDSSFSS